MGKNIYISTIFIGQDGENAVQYMQENLGHLFSAIYSDSLTVYKAMELCLNRIYAEIKTLNENVNFLIAVFTNKEDLHLFNLGNNELTILSHDRKIINKIFNYEQNITDQMQINETEYSEKLKFGDKEINYKRIESSQLKLCNFMILGNEEIWKNIRNDEIEEEMKKGKCEYEMIELISEKVINKGVENDIVISIVNLDKLNL